MKVLLLSHIFPPAIDGGSRVIYKIGQYFQSVGDEILYLSSDCSSTDDFTKKKYQRSRPPEHQNTIYLPVYHHLRRPLKLINCFIPQKTSLHQLIQILQKGPIFKTIPLLKSIYQILKFKPDLIIAGPLPTTIILYARFIKFLSRVLAHQSTKLLINASFHPFDPDFHRLPLIKTLQSADYLWTLTQYESDYFINNFNIDPYKIILAGNGVDQNFLKINQSLKNKSPIFKRKTGLPEKNFIILFIGSLSAHKGLDTLINSFSLLLKANSYLLSTKLIIAGQKTLYYPQIKNQISRLPQKIRSKIKFIFSFPQKKLSQIIDNCDILVLPSKQESFGLVLIEAWARKKPVIVSHIPSLSEIVNQTQGGLIFQLDNPADLTKKIIKLSQNSQLRHQLSQNGFNYVKNNYIWLIVGNKIKKSLTSF